jgi:hypothetical protein
MEHKGKPLELVEKKDVTHISVKMEGIHLPVTVYDIKWGGTEAGEVRIGHNAELPSGKATVVDLLKVTPQGEGIGERVIEHFLKQAKEDGDKLFILRHLLEKEGEFHGKKHADVTPLKLNSILKKISKRTPIRWELTDDGRHKHIVVRL